MAASDARRGSQRAERVQPGRPAVRDRHHGLAGNLTAGGTACWPAGAAACPRGAESGRRDEVRRGSSRVTTAVTATSAAFTDMATTIPETNLPAAGADPSTP